MSETKDGERHGSRRLAVAAMTVMLSACYPHFDWRDVRPDCARSWCGFVASFPDRVSSATRDIPVGSKLLPLSLNVVSLDGVTFAVGAFALSSSDDATSARETFERKLLEDVGAVSARRGTVVLHAADHSEIAATTFDAEGQRDGKAFRTSARFVERDRHLVEIVVIGPAADLASDSARQAIETFFTSLRLD